MLICVNADNPFRIASFVRKQVNVGGPAIFRGFQ